jgi:hypothetical protein
MAKPKRTKQGKRKPPIKKAHSDRAVYSLARKKKGKPHFRYANGEHSNGKNGSLHEDAIPYHTQFTAVLDVALPSALEIEMPDADEMLPRETSEALAHIEKLNLETETRWADKLCVDNTLTRALVSFQANKGRAVYRWFKYKEAFSAGLIEHLLSKYRISKGILLDPFAGSGTALFAVGCKETMKKDAEVYANI